MNFLDTSAVLEIIFGTEKGNKLKNEIGNFPTVISTFTIHELILGQKKKENKIIEQIINSSIIIGYGKDDAVESGLIERELREKGILINKVDIFIGGICRNQRFEIITTDKDFKKIEGLKVKII